MANIQDFFVGEPKYINIPPGEYEGPLVIRHSCTVDGHGATLWAKAENYPKYLLAIEAPNVTIKNLRVELIGKPPVDKFGHNIAFTAIHISNENALLENVEVYGQIAEPFYDEDFWGNMAIVTFDFDYSLPRTIDLGTFAADNKNEFLIKLDGVHENYRVINSVYGIEVEPQTLTKEKNELKLTIAPMRDGTVIFGDLILEMNRPLGLSMMPSKILHRIYVSGRAQSGAETKTLPEVQKKISQPPQKQEQADLDDNTEKKFFPAPPTDTEKIFNPTSNQVAAGQKVSAPKSENILVAFKTTEPHMTIDACAFCLGKNKKSLQRYRLCFLQ